jgi:hypothetical protein
MTAEAERIGFACFAEALEERLCEASETLRENRKLILTS